MPRRSTCRPDWKTERERIDLAAVATSFLGPAPGRRGGCGRRLWWPCPFHDDRNPSFCVEPAKPTWKCFGCGGGGDAAALVMKRQRVDFPEAVRLLADRSGVMPAAAPVVKKPSRPP